MLREPKTTDNPRHFPEDKQRYSEGEPYGNEDIKLDVADRLEKIS